MRARPSYEIMSEAERWGMWSNAKWKVVVYEAELKHFVIPVNNQLDAQFFMNVYFYFLHVSGSHVSIIVGRIAQSV